MVRRRLTRDDTGVITFDRRTFFTEVWDYADGDHVTVLAPFGGGKTQIMLQALDVSATPDRQAVVLVMKPKDKTISAWAKGSGFHTVRDWPPPTTSALKSRLGIGKKPPGWLLWPAETGDPELDDARQEAIFRRCLRERYVSAKKKANIQVVDETYSLENELHLSKDLNRSWTKGRSVGNGQWAGSQRAAYIGMWAYQAQHLLIGHDPDRRAQDRYADIGGGFDPEVIKDLINSLQRFEFLYIAREQRAMCIIAAN